MGMRNPVMYGAPKPVSVGITFYGNNDNSKYYTIKNHEDYTFYLESVHGNYSNFICETSTETSIGSEDIFIDKSFHWFLFRIQIQSLKDSTQIKAKIWLTGNHEPENWPINCKDISADRLSSGTIGLWAGLELLGQWRYWDNFLVLGIGSK